MDHEKILEELERYSNADGYQYTIQAQAAEAIRTLLDENKRVWVNAKSKPPERGGSYLCVVARPDDGGMAITKSKMLLYFNAANRRWNCEGMLVTHWMPLPGLPEA